jgi:predicted hotdog family 3-hydroxylacyl-ACP dehydratase
MLTREQIQARVPHGGHMCLLDLVETWDEATITCRAAAPTAAHPLARESGLPAAAAVEYAAQAAAVHGALLDDADGPRHGLLAKLTDVDLSDALVDEGGGLLTVTAELLARVESGCQYRFEVRNERVSIARGRLLVAFLP